MTDPDAGYTDLFSKVQKELPVEKHGPDFFGFYGYIDDGDTEHEPDWMKDDAFGWTDVS